MSRKPSLVRYIEQCRREGKGEQAIRDELLEAGWQMDIILQAMHTNMYTHKDNQVVPLTKNRLQKSKELLKWHAEQTGKKIAERRKTKQKIKKRNSQTKSKPAK